MARDDIGIVRLAFEAFNARDEERLIAGAVGLRAEQRGEQPEVGLSRRGEDDET